MLDLQINRKNQKPLTKTGRRGNYSVEEKLELMSIPRGENISLHLKTKAAKFNRNFANVRNQYYKILKDAERVVESTKKELSIPKRTVEQIEVSKNNSIVNAYSKEETDLIMSEMNSASNKVKKAKELESILDNRSWMGILARYNYIKGKKKVYIKQPEEVLPLFIKEEQTTMYRAELSDSLHILASDAVKANIRAIIDTIPDKDADDSVLHNWFNENANKVRYLLDISSKELWIN